LKTVLTATLAWWSTACSCQDLADDPPDASITDGQTVRCPCTITGSGPLGTASQSFDVSPEVCVPAEFAENPTAFCQSDDFQQFLKTAGLSVAEDQNGAACQWVSLSVSCTEPADADEAAARVRSNSACAGVCQSVICDDSNCSRQKLEDDDCECTVASACGGFSRSALCSPSFEGGIAPPDSEPLSAGAGANGMRAFYAKPGTWLTGSSVETEVNFDACFTIFCKHIEDSAIAGVMGSFELFGKSCPGETCNLGLSTRANVETFSLDLDGNRTITGMVIDVISLPGALTVGPDGTGTIAPDSLLINGKARINDEPKAIRQVTNSVAVPFSIDWNNKTISISNLTVPFPGNEGNVTVNLVGQFSGSFAESFPGYLLGEDTDADGVPDANDNCPLVANADQAPVQSPVIALQDQSPSCNAPTIHTPDVEDICFGGPVTLTSNAPTSLPLGTTTVTWTAVDSQGHETTATQTFTTRPALLASGTIDLGDRTTIAPGSSLVALGPARSYIGYDAVARDLFATGPITVRDRATLFGTIQSGGSITIGNQVNSSEANLHPFVAPGFGTFPELASTPNPTGSQNVVLEPGQTRTITPGLYRNLVVKSRAVLTLGAGDYSLDALEIEPDAVISVPAGARLFVRTKLIFRGSFSGPGPITLSYSGTSDVYLERAFRGTFKAPLAKVTLGSGNSLSFAGTVAAREIVLRPGVSFTCETN
jgi:hypothetical protein